MRPRLVFFLHHELRTYLFRRHRALGRLLLPRWLRSHDEVSESKSLERYRSAMHVVSIGSSQNTYMTRAEIAEREARTLRKRQITMVGLALFLLVTLTAAVANALPFKSLLLPLSLLLIFVVHVRRQKFTRMSPSDVEWRQVEVKLRHIISRKSPIAHPRAKRVNGFPSITPEL